MFLGGFYPTFFYITQINSYRQEGPALEQTGHLRGAADRDQFKEVEPPASAWGLG